jgi:hypothetical protein
MLLVFLGLSDAVCLRFHLAHPGLGTKMWQGTLEKGSGQRVENGQKQNGENMRENSIDCLFIGFVFKSASLTRAKHHG